MDLLRDWRRRILGGTAAVVLVPVIVIVAALSLSGGFGGLGALGQALTGPEIPEGEGPVAAASGDGGGDDAADLLADAAVATPEATAAPDATRTPRRATRRRSAGTDRPAASPTPDASDPPSGGGGSGPSPTPQPTPTPEPSTIRQVGDQVKEVTDDVPIAGEPAGQVVDTIVETAEQLPLPKIPGVLP